MQGIQFLSNEVLCTFLRRGNYEIMKIHLQNLNIIFSRTTGPISTKLWQLSSKRVKTNWVYMTWSTVCCYWNCSWKECNKSFVCICLDNFKAFVRQYNTVWLVIINYCKIKKIHKLWMNFYLSLEYVQIYKTVYTCNACILHNAYIY